jgi:hypothetical protein
VAAVESILALSQRLQRHAKRGGGSELAVDLRLAAVHLRRYAAVLIREEAEAERDPAFGGPKYVAGCASPWLNFSQPRTSPIS